MNAKIYDLMTLSRQRHQKSFALLVDPDKISLAGTVSLAEGAAAAGVDYIFVGGTLVVSDHFQLCVQLLKHHCKLPVIIFPGSTSQISKHADALLYLSLISGRNADLLIGQHVISAPSVKKSGLEIISTGYMLIDGGAPTAASYISNAAPVPHDKPDIAVCTALAGEMLGMKLIFMDAGSGALQCISTEMIAKVSKCITVPLIAGGGIRTPEIALEICKAGADIVVAGNALETDPSLLPEIAFAIHSVSAVE